MSRSCRLIRSFACASAALITAMLPGGSGLAPARAESSAYELFPSPDSVQPKAEVIQQIADAMRNAQAPGNCPLGRLQIRTAQGDPIFQPALAAARRDGVLQTLDRLGVNVAGRLFVDSNVAGDGRGYDAVYQSARDDKKPQLRTQSEPRKGSRVKAGDTIRVTMTARDDPAPWPTGLKTIQLVADSENGRVIASENYEPCAEPAERRVVATYTVPQNPPAIVRLTAIAEDHVNLKDTDVGEFPTRGSWYGTVFFSFHSREDTSRPPNANRDETKYSGRADLTLDEDGNGRLTGSLTGTQQMDIFWWGYPHGNGEVCRGYAPVTAISAHINGSRDRTSNALTLEMTEVNAAMQPTWSGGGPHLRCDTPPVVDNGLSLTGMVRSLQPVGDGSYKSEFRSHQALQDYYFSAELKPVPPPR
jgi:hypothetical protein